jgi:hypothetical protein
MIRLAAYDMQQYESILCLLNVNQVIEIVFSSFLDFDLKLRWFFIESLKRDLLPGRMLFLLLMKKDSLLLDLEGVVLLLF